MTPEQRERMNQLCKQIQIEQDPNRFSELAQELERLLTPKSSRNLVQPTAGDD
jgi:hypothetical protein